MLAPDRWARVEAVYQAAAALPTDARQAYLARECRDDAALRAEVESLLAQGTSDTGLPGASAVRRVAGAAVAEGVLRTGDRIGVYTIVAPLGAGGMGEVYRAHDAKLGRDVALKVLSSAFALDTDRLERLGREGRILASLNHPHIGAIYGLEEHNGMRGLVLELIDGETLAERLTRGPLPMAEALRIAADIADALAAAHDKGVVHRDLKPANVKLSSTGVKVLDFGIAKASASGADTTFATKAGTVVGTPAYMSPEQARGDEVDRQADAWAFGCVLYEILTGARAFNGRTAPDVISAVLERDPDMSRLPRGTPASARLLIERCLRKDKARRLRDLGDARLDLEEAFARPMPVTDPARRLPRIVLAGTIALGLFIVAAGVFELITRVGRGVIGRDGLYASIDLPQDYVLGEDDALVPLPIHTPFVFTVDGKALIIQAAHAGKPKLFLRSLDQQQARPITGTDDARAPFVSPDGNWVGFFAGGELRKAPIEGGDPLTICPISTPLGPNGATWSASGVILFGDEGQRRIMRVSAQGGAPVPVTAQAPLSRRHVTPSFLSDGKRFLFADVSSTDANDAKLQVQDLDGGDPRILVEGATDGRLLPSGQLAFMRLGSLMVANFDRSRAVVIGDPTVSMRSVMQTGLRVRANANNTGSGMYAVSSTGTLALVRGDLAGGETNRLVWVAPDGHSEMAEPGDGAPTGGRLVPRISPDQSRAVVTVITVKKWELWVADWKRHTWTLCADCRSTMRTLSKAWSPDGKQLLLDATPDTIVAHTLDGSAEDRTVVHEAGRILQPAEWRADGRIIYLSTPASVPGIQDIKLLEQGSTIGKPIAIGWSPAISVDGRWMAFTSGPFGDSNITGPFGDRNITVQAFPAGPRQQVSAGGGYDPVWSADGRTLYYLKPFLNLPHAMMAVDVAPRGVLDPGVPRELFRWPPVRCAGVRCYDLAADGRFLLRQPADEKRPAITRVDIVVNWANPGVGR